ncbi:MAG: phosphate ABC transporter, permease protein PstA [Deltaproteobacteria bacterium RIFOXYD12_FULL_50_9]|nr:MAG: phosphate ABC transporter, permease protein PstA [Deltaproteobacteria bacterium RIFOXYD12_FULL_50_9]
MNSISQTKQSKNNFLHRGEPWVWASGAALAFILVMIVLLLGVVVANGLPAFWPKDLIEARLKDGSRVLGEIHRREINGDGVATVQFKVGNRDLLGLDFKWLSQPEIISESRPVDAVVLERREYGNFFGYLQKTDGAKAVFTDAAGRIKEIALIDIIRSYRPNRMNLLDKTGLYATRLVELLWDEPRESNTEGGLFPAIFGTVLMIFLMSILSFPLGVIAGIYLREYAKPGILVTMVRIAVNNLAGIPSIVYGIFGLGFFIYGMGGAIDQLFFPQNLPTPTFGTGGILWASLTLGLLTVPVVIVSTEEALGAIPKGIREASLACGATRYQTLTRLLLPMASPGILTGFILAMARAAGEVAPLMITGVVKLAPTMPIDTSFPFFHLDRKFMHLGFHIYDIGFQSPNVEATKPMVYVTTLLLLLIVVLMTGTAIHLRNTMKKRYTLTDV